MVGSDEVVTNFIAKLRLTAEVASCHPRGVGDGCCEVNGRREAARGAVRRGAGVWRGAGARRGAACCDVVLRGKGRVQCDAGGFFFRGISILIAQI